jgi:hypothetical protein
VRLGDVKAGFTIVLPHTQRPSRAFLANPEGDFPGWLPLELRDLAQPFD